jgi:CHAT domain-containing protein
VRVLLALNRPGDAFAFAERLRAQSYFESIAAGPVRAGDPSARRAEAELGARIRHLQQALQEERNRPGDQRRGEALIAYSTELDAAERAYGAFLDSLRQSDPRQAAARALETPTVGLVQQRLPAGAALVEYVSGDDGLAVFVVTRSALQARMLPVTHADLVSRVELLRDLLARPGSDRWRQPAAGLYERLIAPIRAAGWLDGVSQLIVAPHGVLHYVPFAALVAGPPAARFLVEDFALTLVPAAAALADSRRRAAAPGSILAAAPARSRLRFAAAEARGVAASAGEDGVALIGTAATESAFKQQAARYRIVHLATHGRFNRVNPLLSGIELESDAGNDGDLQVFEILGLALDAELVTLSACETALGAGLAADVPPGEEFVGLTRAFLTAGSRAVLASLWDIDDRATTAFMTGYYGRARQQPFAVALAGAQRAAIAGGGADSHPARWASFVIVGGL